jgi:hypothetical protein
MNVKQRIRMTASEIAMGRYMRAPDHPPADDEFSRAFDAEVLTGVADPPAADPPAADPPAADPPAADPPAADPPAADPPAADPPAADPPAADPPAADPPAADPPAADPPAADPPAADPPADGKEVDALIDRLASAVASKAPAKASDPPAADPPAAEAPPLFNEAETAVLAKFKEDWPQEHEAINLMQRELGSGIIQYVFDQIAPAVREVKELASTLALRAQVGDLTDGLGEYPSDQEIDQIKDWVKTQPAYLQDGMNGVIDGGTADDVVDLVNRYREATGKQPAGAQVEEPAPQGETELSGAAKQAAEALAPVGSKRSAVQSPEDSSNFDASWARWADMEV